MSPTHARPTVVGVDIGGANLKFATDRGEAFSMRFDLWREPERLTQKLRDGIGKLIGRPDQTITLAVTMTGELADCFESRRDGVAQILRLVEPLALDICGSIRVYQIGGSWTSVANANDWRRIASANWDASARWVAAELSEPGHPEFDQALLVDIGSTTTDLIPIIDGDVAAGGITDRDRLLAGTLVYLGGGRTPVCALVDRLPFENRDTPVINEVFATVDDALLILGKSAETTDGWTADGRSRSQTDAARRLGRMVAADGREVTVETMRPAAEAIRQCLVNRLRDAVAQRVAAMDDPTLIWAGQNAHLLIDEFPSCRSIDLPGLGEERSTALAAYAVARLARRGWL